MRRRLTLLTLLPTGCQAVTGASIKWRAEEGRWALLPVTTLWKISFHFAFMYKCIKPISKSGSGLVLDMNWLFILFSVTYIRALISTVDRRQNKPTRDKHSLWKWVWVFVIIHTAAPTGTRQWQTCRADNSAFKHTCAVPAVNMSVWYGL